MCELILVHSAVLFPPNITLNEANDDDVDLVSFLKGKATEGSDQGTPSKANPTPAATTTTTTPSIVPPLNLQASIQQPVATTTPVQPAAPAAVQPATVVEQPAVVVAEPQQEQPKVETQPTEQQQQPAHQNVISKKRNSLNGWLEIWDSNHQRYYYYNPENKETSWFHPREQHK